MQLTIRGHELAGLLDRAPAGVNTLSLDCFDTLIWRATHAPHDVFAALDLPGGAMGPRGWSEGAARRIVQHRSGAGEINLADVYRHLLPRADEAAVTAAVARELAEEARHAFAFAPAVALMRAAKRRGWRVILVSDMYLSEQQLRAHVAGAAGQDVLALIDRVFVSADHGIGKVDGLFDRVLAALDVAPDTILHVGDNHSADYVAAIRHGLHAAHFEQFDAESVKRLRQEAVAAALIDPAARVTRPVLQPHRAAVSMRANDDAAYVLGHDVLGPVMSAFADWLKGELDAMTARLRRPVRPLFMMRDGYLPLRVFASRYPEAAAAPVEISRFVATRASLFDDAALETYLGEWLHRLPVRTLARQLMLFENELPRAARGAEDEAARAAFAGALRQRETRRRILKRTELFGRKLAAHLAAAGVSAGDAVMLVDIGYNGTAQNLLTPFLEERLGLAVAGRYLFLREGQISGLDKSGLLDVRGYDSRALHALSTSVVVLEQLCNVTQASTVDFTAHGAPIREKVDAKGEQSAVRDAVQAACLAFASEAHRATLRPAAADDLDGRTRAAAATLARLFFMPNAREAALLSSFSYDPNMGSGQITRLFDQQAAEQGLRRRGLPYLDERSCMYAPGEIQAKGLPLALTMFASARFALDLRGADWQVGGIEVPVMILAGSAQAVIPHTAWPTADGFYRLEIPMPKGATLGVQFGQMCEWVQIEEIAFVRLEDMQAERQRAPVPARPVFDGMDAAAPDLFRAAPAGFALVPPPVRMTGTPVLNVVFRPIRARERALRLAEAA